MIAAVGTVAGVFLVDVEAEELLGDGDEDATTERPEVPLPRVVAARALPARPWSQSSSGGRRSCSRTTAARTWREAGGGLPPGFAVAIAEDDPDRMLYAARNRLYVSANGGVFWRSLAVRIAGHRLDRLDRLKETLRPRPSSAGARRGEMYGVLADPSAPGASMPVRAGSARRRGSASSP